MLGLMGTVKALTLCIGLSGKLRYIHVKLKDRKRSVSGKNNYNVLWHFRKRYNAKFHVVAVFKQPERIVASEDMP